MTSDIPFPDDSGLDAARDGAREGAAERSLESAETASELNAADHELQVRMDAALRRQFLAPQPPQELFDAIYSAADQSESEISPAEIALQDELDAALRRQFVAPLPPQELFDTVGSAAAAVDCAPAERHGPRTVLRVMRSAAAVVVSVGLWLLFIYHQWFQEPTRVSAGHSNVASVSDLFDTLVQGGFQPDEAIVDGRQLAQRIRSRHGQDVSLHALPDNVQLLGFARLPGLKSTMTTVLMCRVDGEPVVVFIGHRVFRLGPERFRTPLRVNAFNWNEGRLWALELTPHDEPRVIDLFVSAPDGAGDDVDAEVESQG